MAPRNTQGDIFAGLLNGCSAVTLRHRGVVVKVILVNKSKCCYLPSCVELGSKLLGRGYFNISFLLFSFFFCARKEKNTVPANK